MDRRRQSEFDQPGTVKNEPNFDRSLFREHIRGRLRHFVDTSLELRHSAGNPFEGAESEKQSIIDRLRRSESFQCWKEDVLRSEIELISSTADSSRNLSRALMERQDDHTTTSFSIENFAGQFISTLPSLDSNNDYEDDEENHQPLNSGISFALTGTLSASTFAFMGRNYLKHAVDVLMAPTSEEEIATKCDTLQALTQLPASDMCESEHWSDFKTALRSLLNKVGDDRERRLCDSVLGFLVKLFNASNHNVTVDAFALLADHLKEDVFGSRPISFRIKDGHHIEFDEYGDIYVLQKLRILDEMCLGFVRVMPRYSHQLVSDVAEKMVSIMDSTATADDKEKRFVLTPLLAWSILDSKMKWWRSWMHGRLGRTAVLTALDKRSNIIERLLEAALDFGTDDTARQEDGSEMRLDLLRAAAANRMVESLLLYQESRSILSKHFSTFPDELLDRLLKNAVEGGRRSKFSWKIVFILATNAYGRILFYDERRLRRIGSQLMINDRKYHAKIKLLKLVSEILKSDDHEMESTSRILELSLEYRDGTTTFGRLVMKAISDSIIAAYSRDPDAPLSLVYACFDTCTVLCRTSSGRRLVSENDDLLLYSIKLVKEHSVEARTILPIIASVSTADTACDFAVKKFLVSNSTCDSTSAVLWHRSMEVNDFVGQLFANRLKDLQASVSRMDDPDAINRSLNGFLRLLFPVLCHPDGSEALLSNDVFLRTIMEPLRSEECQDTTTVDISMKILDLTLCRADSLLNIRHRGDIEKEIATLLVKFYSFNGIDDQSSPDVDDCPKFLVQSAVSNKLVEIYSKLKCLGGPGERTVSSAIGDNLILLELILNDPSIYFSSEPSRFILRPATTGSTSLTERTEGESLANFFLNCVERKKRIQHSDYLSEAVKDFGVDIGQAVIDSQNDTNEAKLYQAVLEYGRNLNVLDSDDATDRMASVLQKIRNLRSDTENEIDWFAAVVFLVYGGQSDRAVDFLLRFSQNDESSVKCVWPKLGGPGYATLVNKEIASLVDTIMESELPRVIAAFTLHGITASNVVTFWLNQCFVNILDWPEISNYLVLTATGGVKYQAFFCCCIFYQKCDEICVRAHDQIDNCDLYSFLLGQISFKLHKCIQFLSYLSDKYE